MSKLMKKAVESELNSLITNALEARNKTAAGEIAKHIREGVKNIARKFVKHLPKSEDSAKAPKTSGSGKKAAAKPKKAAKKAKAEPSGKKDAAVKK